MKKSKKEVTMRNLFSLDSPFGQFMDKFGKMVVLNLLCVVCSIPVLTIGPALTSLFYVLFKFEENAETSVVKNYVQAFRKNFRQSFIVHIFMLLVAVILLLGLFYCKQLKEIYEIYQYWQYLLYIVLFIYLMVLMYVYPLLAQFENTILQTLCNAFLMSVTHIGWTLLVMGITVVPLVICFFNMAAMQWGVFFMVVCGFAVIAFVNTKIFKRIFAKYSGERT